MLSWSFGAGQPWQPAKALLVKQPLSDFENLPTSLRLGYYCCM